MTTAQQHTMTLEQTFSSGAQQWHCPVCQRRTVMHYLPQQGRLKTIALDVGDEQATHCTGAAGFSMGAVTAREQAGTGESAEGGLLH